jgi:hypothetical protein
MEAIMRNLFVALLVVLFATPLLAEDKKVTNKKAEEKNTFEAPGLFSVKSPENGFSWEKMIDTAEKGGVAATHIYKCSKATAR